MALVRTSYGSSMALVALTTLGCAVDGTESASAEPTASETTALLVATRVSTGEGVRTEVAARFLRMQHGVVDDQALRMAGAEDLPQLGCRTLPDAHTPPAGPARSLAMLDVGNLSFESASSRIALVPREVPDPVGLVSGVVYFARASDPRSLVPGERFSLVPDRSEDSLPVSALAPHEISDLRVQSREPSGENTFSVVGDTLELAWDAQGTTTGDVVVFDFAAASEPRFRCTVPDDGAERVHLPSQMFGDEFSMSAHRLRRESVPLAQGHAEIRIDIARTFKISRH